MHRGCVVETASVTDFFHSPKTGQAKMFAAGELLL
jgi:hypothetical protein